MFAHGRRNPCGIEIIFPAQGLEYSIRASSRIAEIVLPVFFNPSFLWRFSEPSFDMCIYIHRYPRNFVYIHYKYQTDDGTSTLINVIIIDYFTYRTDSLFGRNNYTVRYWLVSEVSIVTTTRYRCDGVKRRDRMNMFSRKGNEGVQVDLLICNNATVVYPLGYSKDNNR